MEKTKTTKFLGSFSLSKNGGGAGGTNNYDDLINQPAIDGVVLTKNTTKADLGITTGGAEKYGIKGDYASKYGIINAQNGLITYTSDSKEVTVKAGIQLLMPGSDTKTQIGSDIKYTINSTSDVTLFLADGEVKEAEGVYFQTEEPENGQEAYLAWYNPEVGKWQFKSNADGNVWRTPTKAGPLADVHLSETGVIRVDYVGYRVLNDQIFALKSDLPVNAYTAANLVAGKNITIEEVLPEGGIDEHTLACWHFDNSLLDEVAQLSICNTDTATFATGKFGMAVGDLYGGSPDSARVLENKLDVLNDWTVDCDVVISGWHEDGLELRVGGEYSGSQLSAGYSPFTGGCSLYKYGTKLISTTIEKISVGEKPHFAFQKKGNNAQIFINGKKVIDYDLSSYTLSSSKGFQTLGGSFVRIDELRISDIARYTEDFEPPTQPYSLAVPTGKTAINNAITKTSQLTNDSGFITSVNSKTGNVILTGADIQTTYTANPEVTETTTSDVNSAFTQVCEDIHNVLTNVPTGAELMSTTVYPYQAPLATDATLTDVITKVNTILAIMSERGIMKKSS